MLVEIAGCGELVCRGGTGLGRDGGVDRKPDSLAIFESPAALRVWCILAGLALAPMPILYAVPAAVFFHLYASTPPGWTTISWDEARLFAILGLPLTAIFLAWSLPGAVRPGIPQRSIVVLCLLVAYNPLQSFFESHFYGEFVARVADSFSRESPLIWSIRHLDTPLLIALAATALRWRRTLPPQWKVLFHWGLFVCMLWAAGHWYDSTFLRIRLDNVFFV
jgi:hypothetical protein